MGESDRKEERENKMIERERVRGKREREGLIKRNRIGNTQRE